MGSIPTNRQPHVNAYVSRPDGQTWEAISSYLRSASIECGSIEQVGTQASGADGAIRRLTFTLQNDGTDRFSPQDQNSPWNQFGGVYSPLLWPGRQIEIQAAVTAVGVQPGTMLSLFRGYLGERFSTDGPTVDGSARDLVKRLQNKFIVTKRTYGSNTQIIPMEAVAQQILDDNFGIGVIALNCPVPTGRGVKEYELVDLSVWDALVQLTNPWGGWLGYRWNSVAGKWQLTLMQPPRDKGPENPDFTFDASDIYVEQLETSDEDIRNLVVVEYFNDATQQIESVTVQDDASVAEFGERAMKIRTERLHTEADARALAKAALHDMAGYPATVHLNLPFTPEMDLFAGILVTNPRISSTQDFYGVVSVRHDLVWGSDGRCQFRTDVIATGRVTGGHQRWLDMSTNPGAPGRPGYPDNQDNPATPNWDTCEFGRDITLRWFPVSNAVEYEVQRSGSAEVWRGNATTVTLTPISRSETFYLRAINAGHKYSGVAEITLANSTPTIPPQPIIKEFFTALWIEVQPVADTDIQGYYLYTTPCDSQGTPAGPAQKTPLPEAQQVTYQASPGSSFLVEVSAFDVLGEGTKSAPVRATTAYINDPDIPDGMLSESKLQTTLQSKINTASTRAEDYWNQEIGYPTEEDADITTNSYTLVYTAGDIYVGTEIETNPNAFFDITDRSDSEIADANGNPITIVDVRDESGVTLLGAGKPEWYGGGTGKSVTLILSAVPQVSTCRVHYAVRKNLRDLAKDALLKKGVTSKQIDANLVDAIENMKGAPWNETISPDAQILTLATRVSSAEDTLTVHSTSIQNNSDAIALKANQTDLDALTGRVDTAEANITVNANTISSEVTRLEGRIADTAITVDSDAYLWHFDKDLKTTRGLEPEAGYVATLRPGEGKFGGAVAVEEGTTNLFTNGGFEAGVVAPWLGIASASATVVSGGYEGNYSCKLTATADNSWGGLYQEFTVTSGATYTLHMWVKASDAASVGKKGRLRWVEYDSSSVVTSTNYLAIDGIPSNWTKYEISGIINANTVKIHVGVQINETVTGCGLIVDNMQFEQKAFATSFVDGTRANGKLPYRISLPEEWTISLRFQINYLTDWPFVWSLAHGTTNKLAFITYSNGTMRLYNYKDASSPGYFGTIVAGQMHHLVVTKDASHKFNIWFDGVQRFTDNVINPYTLTMGEVNTFYLGEIGTIEGSNLYDELLVLSRAATPEEIKAWASARGPFIDLQQFDYHQTLIEQNAESITTKASQTEVDTLTGRVNTTESEVTQMGNQFAVRVQTHANGKDIISGFGLLNDPQSGSSEFGIMVDKFRVFAAPDDPSEQGTVVFAFDTQAQKLYLLSDLIADGTITANMLEAGITKTLLLQAQLATVDEADVLYLRADKLRVGNSSPNIPTAINSATDHLWHFDGTLQSTQGLQPESGYVATLRPGEGKFGGAVAVEEGTTNLFATTAGTSATDWTVWSHYGNTSYWAQSSVEVDPEKGNVFVGVNADSNDTYLYDYYPFNISAETTYTFSIDLKTDTDYSGTVEFYFRQDSGYTFVAETLIIGKQWQRFSFTGAASYTDTSTGVGLVIRGLPVGAKLYAARPQLEQKSFATSFVDGTRSDGKLQYRPLSLTPTAGTIAFWYTPQKPANAITQQDESPKILQVGPYWDPNAFTLWAYVNNGAEPKLNLYIAGSEADNYWSKVTTLKDSGSGWYEIGVPKSYAITWQDGHNFRVYLNGELVGGPYTIADPLTQIGPIIGLGTPQSSAPGDGLYDELLILPRAATPEEIKAWHSLGAPFYDPSPAIDAGAQPVRVEGSGGYIEFDKYGQRFIRKSDGKTMINFDIDTGNADFGGNVSYNDLAVAHAEVYGATTSHGVRRIMHVATSPDDWNYVKFEGIFSGAVNGDTRTFFLYHDTLNVLQGNFELLMGLTEADCNEGTGYAGYAIYNEIGVWTLYPDAEPTKRALMFCGSYVILRDQVGFRIRIVGVENNVFASYPDLHIKFRRHSVT